MRLHLMPCIIGLVIPASGFAADVGDFFEMSLDELSQVRITGASWQAHTLRDTPASVTVFLQDDLQRLGIRYLHDLLGYVPGLYTSRTSNSADYRVAVRGSSGTTPGILVLYDGQRINTNQSASAFSVFSNVPIGQMARIEVIRGPGAARYGGGPSDTVINLITIRDSKTVSALAGDNQSGELALQWSYQQDKWKLHVAAMRSDSDGPTYHGVFDRLQRTDEIRDPLEKTLLQADLDYDGHQFQLFTHHDDQTGYYALSGSLSDDAEISSRLNWLRYSKQLTLADWTLQWSLSELQQQFTLSTVAQPQGTGPFTEADLLLQGRLEHVQRTGNLTLQRRLGEHAVSFGTEVQRAKNDKADLYSNYLTTAPFTYYGDFRNTGLSFNDAGSSGYSALYVEDDWLVSAGHRVIMGLRHDEYSHTGDATSPRLAWVWTPDANNTLKLLYQQAFTAPSLGQLYNANNPVAVGNPDLQPSTIQSLELVYGWQTSEHAISATLYERHAEDLLSQVQLGGGANQSINAGDQQSTGIELTWDWQVLESLRMKATGSHVFRSHYNLPESLSEQPPGDFLSDDTASLLLLGGSGNWQWTTGAQWRSQEAQQQQRNPALVLINLRYQIDAQAALTLHIDNALDEERFDADIASGLGEDSNGDTVRRLPRPDRTFWLQLHYGW
ncbi:TonB-dependent receptor [Permianibacter sp. IMCC34836]|uniref:TonB-dependent receptor plug domain-containing protein n=1 Tax=Permianibacter fluminis TaxID=2738515 RepID=UPI00155745EE|nr:TonB-dependent receptor [Permianibacter fluminis]NQD37728.1 TonB-dependent receptor [Permianibacter fluminis]